MTDDQKSFIIDMLKTEGWKIIESHFRIQVDERRRLATQSPSAVTEQNRTWYSAEARGMEEILDGVKSLIDAT